MNILYVSHSNLLNGAEQCLLTLIKGLDRGRITPVVVVPSNGPLKDALEAMNIRTYAVPLGWWIPFNQLPIWMHYDDIMEGSRAIAEIIERERIDLVHTNTSVVAQGAIAARMTGRPHVWHLHEVLKNHPRLKPLFPLFLAYRFIDLFSDVVMTVSEGLKREIGGPIAPEKIKVVFNGIQRPEPVSADPSFREEIGFRRDDLVVCTIGSLIQEKGYPNFIEAAGRVLKAHPEAKFVSVGDVWDFELLTSLRKSMEVHGLEEAVRFLGYRSDTWRILEAIDMYVVSSKTESFGLTGVEAMAAGKPVIATRCGGPEEIVVDGETGFLVPVDDPDAMAKAIINLANDPDMRRRMGHQGRNRYERYFTAERYCQDIERVYSEISHKRAWTPHEEKMADALVDLLIERHRERKMLLFSGKDKRGLRHYLKSLRELVRQYGITWKSVGFVAANRKAIGNVRRQVRMWVHFPRS